MREALRLRGAEGYGARDDDATPLKWPSSSWCNLLPEEEKSRPYGRDFFASPRRAKWGARESPEDFFSAPEFVIIQGETLT